MATIDVDETSFTETVEKGIVLLDFWAEWCGPCKRFGPVFEAASDKNPDIVFGKVNTETEQALAGAFRIQSIPTLMVFRDGIMLGNEAGALPAEALDELIRQLRALDMDKIRADIAKQENSAEPGKPEEKLIIE